MSCQLTVFASFQDIRSIKKYLYPDVNESAKPEDFEGWDDSDWGWKDDNGANNEDQESETLSWLQDCQLSVSPAAELMAIAKGERLVLLNQKYNSDDDEIQMRYCLAYEGCVVQEEKETITFVLCLPLASQKRSTQGGPDWTCVIVGFSSGYVRIFTENGTLLLSQIFSEEPVVNIKCKTYEPPRHSADAETHEELNILYKKALVSVDGFSLFQSLRGCRNQVARAAASGSEFMQPPPLEYKKWGLQNADSVMDQIPCGTLTPTPFDQLLTVSMQGGYTGTIRPTPPAYNLHVTAGRLPYTGFYHIAEGSTQPMLTDVAHAVASKLKSALYSQISAASGWFGLSGKQTQDPAKERKKPKIEPATSVTSRFGLHDKRRQGESLALSPDKKLVATTDSFGRIILIDVLKGIAVRIWKGYRDAQVGWIEVKEEASTEQGHMTDAQLRRAIFLVIYAPRRGIIEIWTAQQGTRVAAFNISKWCRMLCVTYGMMGLNNVTFKDVKVQCQPIYLVDPEGVVKVIEIPFHLALSDKNSKRARDLHLLKKIKISLKENTAETAALQGEVIDTLLDIKTASIRHQGLERVLLTKYLLAGFLDTVIKAVTKQIEAQGNIESGGEGSGGHLDYDSKVLLHFCKAEEHLLHTYSALNSLTCDVEMKQGQSDIENLEEKLTKILSLCPEEVAELQLEIENYEKTFTEKAHVKFEADFTMSVVEFLSCFECEMQKEDKCTSKSGVSVQVFKGLNETKKSKLANFLFTSSLESGTSSEYNELLKESQILPEDLMDLLLHLWLSEERRSLATIGNLYSLVKSICCLKKSHELTVECNDVSPWWQRMRDVLTDTASLSSALMVALVGRALAMELGKAAMTEELLNASTDSIGTKDSQSLSEWESVTMDKAQWNVLVRQVEELLLLQCLLKIRPLDEGLVTKTVWEPEPILVTVKKVMDGGRGMLPEFVAKWLAGYGIPPSMLCLSQNTSSVSRQSSVCDTEPLKDEDKADATSENIIVAQFQKLQARLPYSLDSDIVMANCAWEYMVLWNKDPELILPLELALSYLKCIQNGMLQHGLSAMMWQMFVVKKFSAAAFLLEKVGKAPKDRLCRKDVGLSEISLEKFMKHSIDLLGIISQSQQDSSDLPRFSVEDVWHHIQGPTSLVELALDQKESNVSLVKHHEVLAVIMYAVLMFGMKAIKPLSLFDTKGKNAFFKPLSSSPGMPKHLDEGIISARQQFLCRILSAAVQSLGSPDTLACSPSTSPSHRLRLSHATDYTHWSLHALAVAKDLGVESDVLRRHQCCELYSSGFDQLAEELLLSVNNHPEIGSQLLVIAGKRLHHHIFVCDPTTSVDKLSKCSTKASTWLKTLNPEQLKCTDPPMSDTATLMGQVVNQLPEGHSEYKLAIELVELVQNLV